MGRHSARGNRGDRGGRPTGPAERTEAVDPAEFERSSAPLGPLPTRDGRSGPGAGEPLTGRPPMSGAPGAPFADGGPFTGRGPDGDTGGFGEHSSPGVSGPAGTGRRRRAPQGDPGNPGVTPPYGLPQVPYTRGGHPQHDDTGGWSAFDNSGPQEAREGQGAQRARLGVTHAPFGMRTASPPQQPAGGATVPGPRREYVEMFDALDAVDPGASAPVLDAPSAETTGVGMPAIGAAGAVGGMRPVRPRTAQIPRPGRGDSMFGPPSAPPRSGPLSSVTSFGAGAGAGAVDHGPRTAAGPDLPPGKGADKGARGLVKGGKGRTFTGVAAAAVTTVLAVVVAGQVASDNDHDGAPQARGGTEDDQGTGPRSEGRPVPAHTKAPARLTYDQQMAEKFPLDPKMRASGAFTPVAGHDKAPGRGQVLRYRVDVERGLPLDGELFAKAVHKTLNDDRSWGHGGTRTFERVSSGRADFVITLASPLTTDKWCAKSGLDTSEELVSCDSASTERVMINAYRWAQGARTFGDKMHSYRQMLINHEVGHRLGHNHLGCPRDGALAPVMMQQTKFLTTDGATCKPNAWPFPKR